jgi:hypothetical protein
VTAPRRRGPRPGRGRGGPAIRPLGGRLLDDLGDHPAPALAPRQQRRGRRPHRQAGGGQIKDPHRELSAISWRRDSNRSRAGAGRLLGYAPRR